MFKFIAYQGVTQLKRV